MKRSFVIAASVILATGAFMMPSLMTAHAQNPIAHSKPEEPKAEPQPVKPKTVNVRDHRTPKTATVRDHRAQPEARDHRAQPKVRDQRAAKPTVRTPKQGGSLGPRFSAEGPQIEGHGEWSKDAE